MGHKVVWSLLVVFLLSGQALAMEYALPNELGRSVPDAANLVEESADDDFGLLKGAAVILERSIAETKQYLFSGMRSVATLLIGVILLGTMETVMSDGKMARYTTAVGTLWITAVSSGDVSALIGLGQETIARISELSKLLMPALAAATAAAGGVNAASVRQVGTVLFSDLVLTVIERFLLPLLYLFIGAGAADAVLESGALDSIGSFLKKIITWILRGLLILFTTYLTVSGAVAGTVDAQTIRLAKTAVSTAVPVVGRILAEASEAVLAGAGVLRGMIGVFGALAILSICLVPFLRLGVQYLLYQGAGFAAQAVGPAKLGKLMLKLGDAFALVLGMTAACAMILIISLVSTLTVVTAS